jgi:hypothetical protein
MVPERRRAFNDRFTDSRYAAYCASLERQCGTPIEFRLSETPCFLPERTVDLLVETSHALLHQLLDNQEYRRAADAVVPSRFRVPHGEVQPTFVQVDFGLLETPTGLEPRLVELQAFPSLYGFQVAMAEAAIGAYDLADVTPFLQGLSRDAYLALMRRAIVGDHDPAEVVLLEIDPHHQKTLPDFVVTERLWGVRAVDIRTVVRDGRRLWYDRDGRRTPIARLYNRVIPDELERRHLDLPFDFRDDLDLEWTGGPDWFFRLSKFSIPWLRHPSVPRTAYLSEVTRLPEDRENWLLKPLFSFAGGGIIFAPTDEQLASIAAPDRANYVLQERVAFTPTISTPFGPTQAEIRIMMVRDGPDDGKARYRAVLPLVRMGRGKMMGVDYNKGLRWVGAAAGLVEAPAFPTSR